MQNQRVYETMYSVQKFLQDLTGNFSPVMDKLAGTQSEMKLNFQDLTLDTGTVRTKISGQIILSAEYLKQQEQHKGSSEVQTSGENLISKTIVTNVEM